MTPGPTSRSLLMNRLYRLMRGLAALEGETLHAIHEASLPQPLESNAMAAELGELRGAIVAWSGRVRARMESVRARARMDSRTASRGPH